MDFSQPFSQPPMPRPKNWLVESILVTIFCCLPLGIVGIIYAAQVNGYYDRGDYAGALRVSNQAGTWTKVGFGIGLVVIIITFLFKVVFAPHY